MPIPKQTSILPLRQLLLSNISRENAFINVHELLNLLAIQDLLCSLHKELALQRVALDRAVCLAIDHGLEDTLHAIDGNNGDILTGLNSMA